MRSAAGISTPTSTRQTAERAAVSNFILKRRHQRDLIRIPAVHRLTSPSSLSLLAPPATATSLACRVCGPGASGGRSPAASARQAASASVMSVAAPSGGKLKLLCLHGYLQNSEVFRSRIGSMRKSLKSRVEFEFVDGPYEAVGAPLLLGSEASEEQGAEAGGRSWWQWSDSGPDSRPSRATSYSGWEQTMEALVSAVKLHRPDGILGFSQGAAATALLMACLPSRTDLEGCPVPKFAIMISGFLPRDPSFADLVIKARPSIPSLFVYGTSDALVPPDRVQELIQSFEPACTSSYEHAGAHMVPTCSGAFKAAMVAFLEAQTLSPKS